MADPVQKWEASASAWIALQKDGGDYSRRPFLDPPMLEVLGYVQGRRILDLGCDESRFARMLQPGDRFLTATISHLATASDGWVKNADGHKHHRPLNDVLGLILRHGLALTAFLEPRPPNSGPGYAEDARCPTFQIDQFQKGGL